MLFDSEKQQMHRKQIYKRAHNDHKMQDDAKGEMTKASWGKKRKEGGQQDVFVIRWYLSRDLNKVKGQIMQAP